MFPGERTYTVTRPGNPSAVDGRVSYGSALEFDILAALQPAPGHVVARAPEGKRERVSHILFTFDELLAHDLVDVDGVAHEVDSVALFEGMVGAHREAVLLAPGSDGL